ncbi:hypothetical protein Tsubulata_009478 [Turnera subulata]|uniref:Strictosidine synthase conserved region domain-containing protein n=1 Tax=Turnera subulata TaxID=218843 RepID=A0A9Q0GIF0_9ROSI|nr:hypothetical protein Tsubulata_009478 [Turnera subulata]
MGRSSTVLLCSIFFFLSNYTFGVSHLLYEDALIKYHQLDLPGVIGPESIAFDCYGKGPYVSVSDGRILKLQGQRLGWTEFAVSSPNRQDLRPDMSKKVCDGSTEPKMEPTCGRPLGLKFNPATCDLYIADAYFGLLVVGPKGGVARQLAASDGGVPFRFLNALDIDHQTGIVYFTDSSIYYQRREYIKAFTTADTTGRLLKYDTRTNKVTVLVKGLAFPNGVALSKNNSFILVAEEGKMQILKFSLAGSEIHASETLAQLGRFPDNIKRNADGEFWVGLNSARGRIRKLDHTELQKATIAVDWFAHDPVAIKFSDSGKVLKVLNGKGGQALESVSEVEEYNGSLWIGSSAKPYVGYIMK